MGVNATSEQINHQAKGKLGNPLDHIRHTLGLPYPQLQNKAAPQPDLKICIVGGGLSRKRYLEHLQRAQQQNYEIWALDGSYQWLIEEGIKPNFHVMASPTVGQANFVPQSPDVIFLYASQCHPEVFLRASAITSKIIVWHAKIEGSDQMAELKEALLIEGGQRLGMMAVNLAFMMGIREIHLFGYDGSYDDNEVLDEVRDITNGEQRICVQVVDRKFMSTLALAQQINDFRAILKRLIPEGARITMHGEGLLPYAIQKVTTEPCKD